MNKEQEIRNKILECEQMYEKRKGKLALKTWAILSAVFYVATFCFRWMHEPLDFLTGIVLSIIAAGGFIFVSIIVMMPLNNFREHEVATLTQLRTELDLMEKGLLRNDNNISKKPEKSTDKKNDIRICLSDAKETPKPTGSFNIYGSDMKLQPKDENSN